MQKRPTFHIFHFTKKEKNGTVFILFIILLLIAIPFIYPLIYREKQIDSDEFKNEMAVLQKRSKDTSENIYHKKRFPKQRSYPDKKYDSESTRLLLFYFDPNTLSKEGWERMGLGDKAIVTIHNYLSKGGRFKEPGDIKKIWGLREDEITQMLPYIRIEQEPVTPQNFPATEKKEYSSKTISAIEINEADSAAYVSLPGIGPGFAKRILAFRARLGGFYSRQQISETFGLPDSTFQKIKDHLHISGANIKKININIATADEMKEHPYIRYQLANAIIQYRIQHGNFSAVDDLKKIMLVTEELFVKLSPYLTVN